MRLIRELLEKADGDVRLKVLVVVAVATVSFIVGFYGYGVLYEILGVGLKASPNIVV